MRSFALLSVLTSVAHAQPSLTPPSSSPEAQQMPPGATPPVEDMIPGEDSYRYQTFLVDLGAIALTAVAVDAQDDGILGASLLVYALGAPTVHAAHGHGGRAGISLGMRVALPIVGSYALAQAFDDDDEGAYVGLLFGFVLGAGTAMVIDTAVLPKGTPARRRSLTPIARPTTGGAIVGISSSF